MRSDEPDVPVFVDGPLKGTIGNPITLHVRSFGMWHQCAPVADARPGYYTQPENLLYRFTLMPVLGHIVLIGSIKNPPSEDDLFEVLISLKVKATAVHETRPRTTYV